MSAAHQAAGRRTRKREAQVRPEGICRTCQRDTSDMGEFAWMVRGWVWRKAIENVQRVQKGQASTFDFLCVACFEARLGRQLRWMDFDWDVPLNYLDRWDRSALLQDRMR